uniref:CAAX prenyl protease 2/Lysostaphin resistance protein A-like domain-containing protein n=1 Tax=Polytomella parva TaxID=51329 RepID=A0A7S0YGQ9_9CHLO|mmetsp:Transcript_1820/g.2646  ORF Transcript_1820/g.2646 Transcript_1820/m.2646 type:complete len:530 (+) Transcript_1820:216-1805(+)
MNNSSFRSCTVKRHSRALIYPRAIAINPLAFPSQFKISYNRTFLENKFRLSKTHIVCQRTFSSHRVKTAFLCNAQHNDKVSNDTESFASHPIIDVAPFKAVKAENSEKSFIANPSLTTATNDDNDNQSAVNDSSKSFKATISSKEQSPIIESGVVIPPWNLWKVVQVLSLWWLCYVVLGQVLVPLALELLSVDRSALSTRGHAVLHLALDLSQLVATLSVLYHCLAEYRPRKLGMFPVVFRLLPPRPKPEGGGGEGTKVGERGANLGGDESSRGRKNGSVEPNEQLRQKTPFPWPLACLIGSASFPLIDWIANLDLDAITTALTSMLHAYVDGSSASLLSIGTSLLGLADGHEDSPSSTLNGVSSSSPSPFLLPSSLFTPSNESSGGGAFLSSEFSEADFGDQLERSFLDVGKGDSGVGGGSGSGSGDIFTHVLYFVVVSACAPVWEEALFRGFLLPSLLKYCHPYVAVLASALIFAMCHFKQSTFLPLLALGVLFSSVFLATNNLVPSVVLHGLWNLYVLHGLITGRK